MPLVSRAAAARLAGVSRATLYRHIAAGKVSSGDGGLIDTSELRRVYGEMTRPVDVPDETALVTLLREEVADLRRRLDDETQERRRLTLAIEDHRRPWWQRWRG